MMNGDVLHTRVQASRSAVTERGQERQVAVQVGRSFGFDLRPSRLFVWAGAEREGHERIVSLGKPPARMQAPRRRRWLKVGPAEISYLGSPAVTLPLSAWRYAQHVRKQVGGSQQAGVARPGGQQQGAEKPGDTV
jgi:hypothetical protein